MTLQIGLVGIDGIVLAGDRLVNDFDHGEATHSLKSKFEHNDTVVCCWAGYLPAMYAANFIRDFNWTETSDRAMALRHCGDRGWAETFGTQTTIGREMRMICKVLVAFPRDSTLWDLDVSSYSTATQVFNKAVSGDTQTTAKHLVNTYISEPILPVERLITLAAHAIFTTGREDSAYVGGLEISRNSQGRAAIFLINGTSASTEIHLGFYPSSDHQGTLPAIRPPACHAAPNVGAPLR